MKKKPKLIFVASPYRGDVKFNITVAQKACAHVMMKGHVPFAPHLFFTQFLDDTVEEQRRQGIQGGVEIMKKCDEFWWFGNELTDGMRHEMRMANELGIPIKHIKINLAGGKRGVQVKGTSLLR